MIASQGDGSIWIRQLDSDRPAHRIVTIAGCDRLCVDARAERIACSLASCIEIRDIHDGALISRIAQGYNFGSDSMSWHQGEDALAFVTLDLRVHLWDVTNDRELAVLRGHNGGGVTPTLVAGGDVLTTTSWEGQIRFWDWRAGKRSLMMPGDIITTPFPNDRLFVRATDGPDSTSIWQVESAREYRTIALTSEANEDLRVWNAAIHPSGRVLAQCTSRGMELYDLANGRKLATLPDTSRFVRFDPSGAILAHSSNGLFRYSLEFESRRQPELTVGDRKRLSLPATHFAMDSSRDGNVVAVAAGSEARYTVGENQFASSFHWDCRHVAVSPDGRWLATGSHFGTAAKIWSVDNHEEVKELLPGIGLMGVAFSPGGKWLATTGGGLRLWHVDTWKPGPFLGNIHGFAFNADDTLLAVESGGGRIRLLEPETGRELARLDDPNQDDAHWLSFTQDGTKLVASSAVGKTLHIWDLRRTRAGLAELGLDWDAPAFPAELEDTNPTPIAVRNAAAEARRHTVVAWTVAIALQPFNPESYFRRALARLASEDLTGAYADLTTAIRMQPGQLRFHSQRAAIGQMLDDYPRLIDDYQEMLRLDPKHAGAFNGLAWIYVAGPMKYRDLEKALPWLVRLSGCNLASRSGSIPLASRFSDSASIPKLATLWRGVSPRGRTTMSGIFIFWPCAITIWMRSTKARDCYDRAARWRPETTLTPRMATELASFKEEAELVLGITISAK